MNIEKYNYAQTYYSNIVFYRLEILEESLSLLERNNMLEQIKKYGVSGLPDFIGLKNGVLYLIEAKDIKEKLFQKQHNWLNWFALNTKAQVLLIRIQS